MSEGSVEQSHIDSQDLLEYKKSCTCNLSDIDASESTVHTFSRRFETLFNCIEVVSLKSVYGKLYPGVVISHVPMVHERFYDLKVFHEKFLSTRAKGSHSPAVCAYWAGLNGNISDTCDQLRVGIVQYFLRHTVSISTSATQFKRVAHVFARIH